MVSSLSPSAAFDLQSLLSELLVSNNAVRIKAEERLNTEWVTKNPDLLMLGLCEQIHSNPNPSIRSFASVLFRRISSRTSSSNSNGSIYNMLEESHKIEIKRQLLLSFKDESIEYVRHKISDTIAEVARSTLEEQKCWQELLSALFEASHSHDDNRRESAFRVFSAIPEIIDSSQCEGLKAVFKHGFEDTNQNVHISAVSAFTAFYSSSGRSTRHALSPLIVNLLNTLPPLLCADDSDGLSSCLSSLIELAEITPKVFKPYFGTIVQFCISVVKSKDLEINTRQSALELLVVFSESAPNMCRKDEIFVKEVVTQCLSLMTDVGLDDDNSEEWKNSDDLDLDESDANHVAGEQAMDRLAIKLGGNIILPPTFVWLPQMISSSQWQERHAALMTISAIAEGCKQHMKVELAKVLDMVLPLLQDPHPRVRWAACNAIGQMSTDFAGDIQEKYHSLVMPALIAVLSSPESRVQAHAAAALVNFCEETTKDVIEPYLDYLLENLLRLLQNPKMYVQEQAVTTIATVADAAEGKFIKYYDSFMPLLIGVLKQAVDKEFRLLRGKAMECASLIALAVGKEKFKQTSTELIQLLGIIQSNVTEPDDPQAGYLVQCWGRICRVIGDEFVPFLDAVIPPLLDAAKSSPQVTFVDDDNAEQYIAENGWDVLNLKGRNMAIQTSSLEDKCTAVEMLVCYAEQLQAAFNPYVSVVLNTVILPSLSFLFHDGVRSAAARCLPQILNARKKGDPQHLLEIWLPSVEKILLILQEDPLIDVLAQFYECLYECIEVMGTNCLTDAQRDQFITITESVLQDYVKRLQWRITRNADEDDDDYDQIIESIEEDADLFAEMNKTFHSIFKHHRNAFLPQWQRLSDYYVAFLNHSDPVPRQWALCIMADLVEFCGEASFEYKDIFVTPMLNSLSDKEPSNRQASAYGIGVIAQYGGERYKEICLSALTTLLQSINHPAAREADQIYATENSVAATAKILKTFGNYVDETIYYHWIAALPIINDEEAAPYAYMLVNQLIERKHPAILAQIPKVFDVIMQALEVGVLSGKIRDETVKATKTLMARLSTEETNAIVNSMPLDRQKIIAPFFT